MGMEDFALAGSEHRNQTSGLQTEWLETQLQNRGQNQKAELAFTLVGAKKERLEGPGRDVAERLDKELKEFATAKLEHPSKEMQSFQQMIGNFVDSNDKKSAIAELGNSYSKLKVQLEKDAAATYDAMQAEGAKQPGREKLEADFASKSNAFWDKMDNLPDGKKWDLMGKMDWKEGETQEQHRARVREILKDNKGLLAAYDSMEAAADKVDANKSAKEKSLEADLVRQVDDYNSMKPVVEKAYIRSTIKY